MTAHVILDQDYSLDEISKLKKELKHDLEHENIQHVTLEFETENDGYKEPYLLISEARWFLLRIKLN